MTREELIEQHIYVPTSCNDELKAHFNLGDEIWIYLIKHGCICAVYADPRGRELTEKEIQDIHLHTKGWGRYCKEADYLQYDLSYVIKHIRRRYSHLRPEYFDLMFKNLSYD